MGSASLDFLEVAFICFLVSIWDGATACCLGNRQVRPYIKALKSQAPGLRQKKIKRLANFTWISGQDPSEEARVWPTCLAGAKGALTTSILKDSDAPFLVLSQVLKATKAIVDFGAGLIMIPSLSKKPVKLVETSSVYFRLSLFVFQGEDVPDDIKQLVSGSRPPARDYDLGDLTCWFKTQKTMFIPCTN